MAVSPETVSYSSLDVARAALRLRQGLGARYDAPNAPSRELGWARRGAAYFARKLNELADAELRQPSLVDGWSRQHVAASIGYQARALTRLTERARTGADLHLFVEPGQREAEIIDGATLPAGALRHLVTHADIHLTVEWRDLSVEDWDRPLDGLDDEPATIRQTPWLRAREIWLQAVKLGNGGTLRDAPTDFQRRLIDERLEALNATEPAFTASLSPGGGAIVVAGQQIDGPLHELAQWLSGCGARLNVEPDPELQQRVASLTSPAFRPNSNPIEKAYVHV
jgi:maleylpyruvate isomerase